MLELIEGMPSLDVTATDPESLTMLFSLINYVRPKRIVEAGTYRGHFSVGAAKLLPDAEVVTFDPTNHNIPKLPNLFYVQSDFDPAPGFDFAFIDSGPPNAKFDVRERHWNLAKERVQPGGLVVAHDTLAYTSWIGGEQVVTEGLTLAGGRGLTLWQK